MGEVFVIYGNQIERMVRQLLEKTGAMDRLRPDDRVMIKPNLLVSRQNWVGINTDPRVVDALVGILKEREAFIALPLGMAAAWDTAPRRHLSIVVTGIWRLAMD